MSPKGVLLCAASIVFGGLGEVSRLARAVEPADHASGSTRSSCPGATPELRAIEALIAPKISESGSNSESGASTQTTSGEESIRRWRRPPGRRRRIGNRAKSGDEEMAMQRVGVRRHDWGSWRRCSEAEAGPATSFDPDESAAEGLIARVAQHDVGRVSAGRVRAGGGSGIK